MAWQCPKCGADGNDDSTSKCLTCGEYSSQNEINAVVQHQEYLKQVAELQSDPQFIAVAKATEQVAHRESRLVVLAGLVENGYDEAYAHELYEKLLSERREMARSGSWYYLRRGLLLGAGAFGIGLLTLIVGAPVVIVATGMASASGYNLVRCLIMRFEYRKLSRMS
jgi:hypothetical protein